MGRRSGLLLLVLLSACTPSATHKVISAADLADPARTRISSTLRAPRRDGSPVEEAPSYVKPEVIADEALITKLTAGQVCFDLVIRTAVALDAPLGTWRVAVNGRPGQIGGCKVTLRDFPATGEAPVTLLSSVTQEQFSSRRIGEPKEIAFRVVERRTSACFARGDGGKRVTLALTLPAADGRGDWGVAFEWEIR